MESLYISFSAVFPLFSLMIVGFFLKSIKFFDDKFASQLNNLCFKVFLSTSLFNSIYGSDFKQVFSAKLVLYCVVSVFVLYFTLFFLVPVFDKRDKNRGVIIQGSFRGNILYFGLPLATSIYGADNIAQLSIVIAFVVPIYNVLSVLALEKYSSRKTDFLNVLKSVFKNPLIIATIIALFFTFTGIQLPVFVEDVIGDVAGAATPLALIVLGASFKFSSLGINFKPAIATVLIKTVISPLIFIPIAVMLGFSGIELIAIFLVFGTPTAVSSFTMAQAVKANDELAGQVVVFATLLSVGTIFVWITVLGLFNLL